MYAMDALRIAANNSGITLSKIGLSLGKSRQYVNAIITGGNTPKCDTMAAMLNVCGYELAAIPADAIPDNAIVIDAKAD